MGLLVPGNLVAWIMGSGFTAVDITLHVCVH